MSRIYSFIAGLGMIMLLALPTQAAGLTLTGSKIEIAKGGELLTIQSNQPIEHYKYQSLENPDRIVVDIPSARGKVGLPGNYKGKLIKGIRFGQFNPETSRIVLDLAQPASIRSIKSDKVLTIELVAGKGKAVVEEVEEPKEKPKPLITIDAGHGGQDPGTTGLHDTHERDVTLNYAKTLARELEATGRYRAKLTRNDDTYIPLPERVEIGRRAKTDLFISIHADSNPQPEAHGLSIYTLSATASDKEAAALAERENKSDIISGLDLNTTDADVANILIDLTQRETMNKSTNLADDIVRSLHPKISKLPSTHRFAGFRVLKAPDVPSVLIELGFLSNATDERLLLSQEYREAVVQSVIKGIDRYYATQ